MDWSWIGTTLLAVYGAGLSTYREVMARREKRVDLIVILSFDMLAFTGDGTQPVPYLQVRVENHGGSNITFNTDSVSLNIDGYTPYMLILEPLANTKFPCVLTPGTSFYLTKPREVIIESIRALNLGSPAKVRALIQDAINRPFYSKWVSVDLTE